VSDPSAELSALPLEERVTLLEAALDASQDGIIIIGLDQRIIKYNRRYLQLFRFNADVLARGGVPYILEQAIEQLEDGHGVVARAHRYLADPSGEVLDVLRFKDGRIYERFSAPLRMGDRSVGLVYSFSDISRPVRSEQALEQHRAFLEKAQEVAHIGSWVADFDGSGRLGWSLETHRIFGVPAGQFAGHVDGFFALVHKDDLDALRRSYAAAVASGTTYDVEHRIVRSDGEVRWVHERADALRDEAANVVRMVGTVQDITERRRLEDQLRQSQKLEAIGRLAGGVAHDINNALTAIAGYTELALGALDSSHPAKADVAEIRRGAERAAAVTRQLLAFSRRQLREPKVFSLVDAAGNIARMLERMLGEDIELRTDFAPDAPSLYGDPGQIEQAIVNLAINARDAMPGGGRLTLSLSTAEIGNEFMRAGVHLPAGRYAELQVADTGHGMSDETKAHIFEPFFTTKEVGKGTGLGLPMVYGTVKQSAGFIFVDSQEGVGTTFKLYFPAADAPTQTSPPVVPVASIVPIVSIVAGEPGAPARTGQPTVLVVEDETAVRNLVVTSLSLDGYRILHAASADAAMTLAAEAGTIDVLLTDANMPGKSGLELASALLQQRPGLSVIVMSGYTDEMLEMAGLPTAVALLPKPFTPKDLRQKVREILSPQS
jgi:two-component system, cell cycle sensor histidine kinase and response regulator CckA